jgi:hypothetical protein
MSDRYMNLIAITIHLGLGIEQDVWPRMARSRVEGVSLWTLEYKMSAYA